MPPVFIPFDGWSPNGSYVTEDGSYFGEGWEKVHNLMPFYSTTRPLRRFVTKSANAAFGPMNGRHAHLWMTGAGTTSYVPDQVTLFTGSKTRLFTVDPASGAFTDVSRAANYATAVGAEPGGWRFASVGNDIWATNWFDDMQRRVANAGLFDFGIVGSFQPHCRHLATIREHLVGANLSNAGRFQDEFVWSDADNATTFDPPTTTSTSIAGSKRLISVPGQITGLLGGQYGLAFKRRSIFVLEYTGTTQVFRPDVLSPHVGTAYSSSIINSRYGVFFLGPDGFYQLNGLAAPVKISPPGLDQFLLDSNFSFQGQMTPSLEDTQMVGFQFPGVPLVGWIYHLDWGQFGSDLLFLYNPVTQQWTSGDVGTIPVLPTMIIERPYANTVFDPIAAFTWDGSLSRYAPIDTLGTSLKAPVLRTRFRPANFEQSGELGQTIIKGILPIFSKTGIIGSALAESVTIETLLDPANAIWASEGPRLASQRNPASGYYPFVLAGRLFRITINCAAEDFADFSGIWVDQELLT